MAWEYLQNKDFELRFRVIAAYLKGKTRDKVILDLDCGTANTVLFLEPDYKCYIGNDICKEYLKTASQYKVEKTRFYCLSDKELGDVLKEKVNVLLALGLGAGTHPMESPTLSDSLIFFIKRDKPEIVVIEAVTEYDEKYNILRGPEQYMLSHGYRKDAEIKMDLPDYNNFVNFRKFLFFRKTKETELKMEKPKEKFNLHRIIKWFLG